MLSEEIRLLFLSQGEEPKEPIYSGLTTGLISHITHGRYESVLFHPIFAALHIPTTIDALLVECDLFLKNPAHHVGIADAEVEYALLCFASASLLAFLQDTCVGPHIVFTNQSPLFSEASSTEHFRQFLQPLVDNEQLDFENLRSSNLLTVAYSLIHHLSQQKTNALKLRYFWEIRAISSIQKNLGNPSHTLNKLLSSALTEQSGIIQGLTLNETEKNVLTAQLYLEASHGYQLMERNKRAKEALQRCINSTPYRFKLTGRLGVRTEFQQDLRSQLVLVIESPNPDQISAFEETYFAWNPAAAISFDPNSDKEEVQLANIKATPISNASLPKIVEDKEKDILSVPKLIKTDEPTLEFRHSPLLSSIILTQATVLLPTVSVLRDDLIRSHFNAFVEFCFSNPTSFALFSYTLLLRARSELHVSRTFDRATLQMDALSAQFSDPLPDNFTRMHHIFSGILYPSHHRLRFEVAEDLLRIGAAASAFELFESLGMWNKMADCLVISGQTPRAKAIVEKQLEKDPNDQKALLSYGDVMEDIDSYLKVWELSNHKSAAAMRRAGMLSVKKQDWPNGVEYLKAGLAINAMFPSHQFALGSCCLRLNMFQEAVDAFRRCVQFSGESNSDAWSNMGAAYARMNKPENAYLCFEQAVKSDFNNWRMWQNLLFTSIDTKRLGQAVFCMNRLVDLHTAVEMPSLMQIVLLWEQMSDNDGKSLQTIAQDEAREEVLNLNSNDQLPEDDGDDDEEEFILPPNEKLCLFTVEGMDENVAEPVDYPLISNAEASSFQQITKQIDDLFRHIIDRSTLSTPDIVTLCLRFLKQSSTDTVRVLDLYNRRYQKGKNEECARYASDEGHFTKLTQYVVEMAEYTILQCKKTKDDPSPPKNWNLEAKRLAITIQSLLRQAQTYFSATAAFTSLSDTMAQLQQISQ
ncbi:putative Tetratricopeptide repeat protein 27 [Blattamonas nauphoetae]|uniref:Tetratricopeptide repeat protein 27 n=1 Tax=Blattamonas nauphoetae TaxID=2049346 RepID=A0ABQ9YH90_9EUKA|nr:putative Tetratricopeptide repeat protein 27 [Blattamonas nauphoetae]